MVNWGKVQILDLVVLPGPGHDAEIPEPAAKEPSLWPLRTAWFGGALAWQPRAKGCREPLGSPGQWDAAAGGDPTI